jgi:hypothetical protein
MRARVSVASSKPACSGYNVPALNIHAARKTFSHMYASFTAFAWAQAPPFCLTVYRPPPHAQLQGQR